MNTRDQKLKTSNQCARNSRGPVRRYVGMSAAAQSGQIQGVINRRSGPTMTVQTQTPAMWWSSSIADTSVEDVAGIFHARKKQMGVTALVPGLAVQGEGELQRPEPAWWPTPSSSTASPCRLRTDIQAGVAPVEQQTQQQQQEIAQQQAKLQQQQAQLRTASRRCRRSTRQQIAAEKAAVAAVNKRFGELGDYNIWDEVTVLLRQRRGQG